MFVVKEGNLRMGGMFVKIGGRGWMYFGVKSVKDVYVFRVGKI